MHVMNNYKESDAITDSFELKLSTPEADLYEAYLTVLPQLNSLTYFMYYYPMISFFLGVSTIFVTLSGTLIFSFFTWTLISYASSSLGTGNESVRPIKRLSSRGALSQRFGDNSANSDFTDPLLLTPYY